MAMVVPVVELAVVMVLETELGTAVAMEQDLVVVPETELVAAIL